MTFSRVLVAGTGLIGASLGMALRERHLAGEVVGLGRRRENLETAVRRGAIDRYELDPRAAAHGVDLVVLAAPVRSLAPLAEAILPATAGRALVIDVGSVKATVVAELEKRVTPPRAFVGCHPIAGSERSGAEHAEAALFEGRPCILTPTGRTDRGALGRVRELWEALGMRVDEMSPAAHDRLFALVSHLPHVVSWALVGAVEAERIEDRDPLRLAGGSFRDTSRVAGSHPDMWTDIFLDNREEILRALDGFEGALAGLRRLLEGSEPDALRAELERLRRARQRLDGGEA